MVRAYDGTLYLPGLLQSNFRYLISISFFIKGIVGLNNIKANDYCNVILQVNYYLF